MSKTAYTLLYFIALDNHNLFAPIPRIATRRCGAFLHSTYPNETSTFERPRQSGKRHKPKGHY